LLQEVGGADAIGPILLGLRKPVHVLQLGSQVRSIYNMVLIAVIDAQIKCKNSEASGKLFLSGRKRLKKRTEDAETRS
ncbi:MAG: phosphate acyltransferase, partial [Bacteroidota bacterium]|nr:phosphate acyltransferase [Bacteroidota bacterium]